MTTLEASVKSYLQEFRRSSGTKGLSRIEGFFDNMLGKSRCETGDPRQRNGDPGGVWIPGLRAQPWYDPGEIRGIEEIRTAHSALAREGGALLAKGRLALAQENRGDLDYDGWMTFDLMALDIMFKGKSFAVETLTYPKNRKLAPRAAALLERLPLIGDCFYSALKPGGVVEPHFSHFNGKLICHLGLSVPPDCGIRVAGEVRTWADAELLVFDDTFTHDTWNRSAKPRLLFHVGVWHPDLTPLEVKALSGWFERSKPAA